MISLRIKVNFIKTKLKLWSLEWVLVLVEKTCVWSFIENPIHTAGPFTQPSFVHVSNAHQSLLCHGIDRLGFPHLGFHGNRYTFETNLGAINQSGFPHLCSIPIALGLFVCSEPRVKSVSQSQTRNWNKWYTRQLQFKSSPSILNCVQGAEEKIPSLFQQCLLATVKEIINKIRCLVHT